MLSFTNHTFDLKNLGPLFVFLFLVSLSSVSHSEDSKWSNIGFPGVFVTTLTATDSALYAGTVSQGVFKKNLNEDNGWTSLGLTDRVIGSILIDPTHSETMYIGVGSLSDISMFKSTDGGLSWFSSENGLPDLSNVYSLAIRPNNSSILYAGTQYGLYKSEDEGTNWENVKLNDFPGPIFVYAIAVDQTHPDTLYVGGEHLIETGFIYKTVDGGATWSLLDIILMDGQVRSIAIDPLNTQIAYAADGIQGLFKSIDGGGSWSRIYMGGSKSFPSSVVLDPSNTTTVYLGTYNRGVLKTIDSGEHWSEINTGLTNLNIRCLVLDRRNSDIIYAATKEGVFQNPIPLRKGDVNGDGEINIVDVIHVVNIILGLLEPDSAQFWAADYNDDNQVDVIDVILIVNKILL
jgi:hypothetical protein